MKRWWWKLALALGLLVSADAVLAQSGKSYSSGGKSSSSSSSRPSSSSSSRPSSTKPSSSSGKSYSSGSKTAPSPSISSKTAPSPSTSTKPSSSTPSTSGSNKGYSSGSNKSSPSPPVIPTPSKGKSYSSGNPSTKSTPSGKSYTTGSDPLSKKPSASGYDAEAGRAQAREESRAVFSKGQEPRSTYTTPKGETRRLDPRDAEIDSLRRQLDQERWTTRQQRQRDVYGPYVSRPVVVYSDPYSNLFWWYLLDQSLERRAMWAYHHRERMDQARYRDLLAHDARLEAQVRELEAQKVTRDPSYTLDDANPDLMYDDEYVEAVYNPQRSPPPAETAVSCWDVIRTLLILLLVLAVIAGLIWLVFYKRWGASP